MVLHQLRESPDHLGIVLRQVELLSGVAAENLQARVRGTLLMGLSTPADPPPPDPPCDPDVYCPIPVEANGSAWSVGGLARIGSSTGRGVQPYGVLGIGIYRFAFGDVLGGYSAGGGLRWRAGSSYAISLDGRWHDNWTNPSSDRELGFITAGLGVTLLH